MKRELQKNELLSNLIKKHVILNFKLPCEREKIKVTLADLCNCLPDDKIFGLSK